MYVHMCQYRRVDVGEGILLDNEVMDAYEAKNDKWETQFSS